MGYLGISVARHLGDRRYVRAVGDHRRDEAVTEIVIAKFSGLSVDLGRLKLRGLPKRSPYLATECGAAKRLTARKQRGRIVPRLSSAHMVTGILHGVVAQYETDSSS